jgi:hypothetical protein
MTDILFFIANLLFCLAYVLRDMAYLRAISIIASLSTLPYFYFLDPPLYSAMAWQIAFIAVNGYNLTVLMLERRSISLNEQERWLHDRTFRMLTPQEMRRLLRPTSVRHCDADVTLIREGESMDHLILLLRGTAEVFAEGEYRATLKPGDFAGEMSFVTDKPASAAVIAREPVDYLQWQRSDLDEIYHRDAGLKDAMQGVIGADMAQKLAR